MFKAAVFDMDGTLVDSFDTLIIHFNRILNEYGLPGIQKAQCPLIFGRGLKYAVDSVLSGFGVADAELRAEIRIKIAFSYGQNPTEGSQPYPGVLELIRHLRFKNIRLAILTNKPEAIACKIASSLFGEETFDVCFGQREDMPLKPDPAALLAILNALEIEAKDCMYIGDSDIDIITGKRAGVFTAGVLWGLQERQALVEAGADLIVDKPESIGAWF
jgi:phosphoglycolate phosphatase